MAAFLAALRQFITQKRKPATLCSDHGTKFVGTEKELFEFQQAESTLHAISEFCSSLNID